MGIREQVVKDIETLKNDTSKVIKDLTLLSSKVADTAGEEMAKGVDTAQAKFAAELARIRIRLDQLNQQLAASAKKLDHNVHANPYPWVAGALGIGWLFGRRLRS